VLPGARKFTELGLRPEREIEEIAPVEKLPGCREARTGMPPMNDRGAPPGSLRYFAVLFAPAAVRPQLEALYSFEAEIRDTVAAAHEVAHTRLQWWRGEIDRLAAGHPGIR